MRSVFYVYLLFYIFMSGCGYTTRGFTYKENKIYILPVINKIKITAEARTNRSYTTYPILIEKALTNILVSKFNVEGHLKVVNDKKDALILKCEIKDYRKETLRYTESEDVKEQRLRLYVHMKLYDSEGNLFKEQDIMGDTSFFLTGEDAKTEEQAQRDLINDTARRIVEAVTEEW